MAGSAPWPEVNSRSCVNIDHSGRVERRTSTFLLTPVRAQNVHRREAGAKGANGSARVAGPPARRATPEPREMRESTHRSFTASPDATGRTRASRPIEMVQVGQPIPSMRCDLRCRDAARRVVRPDQGREGHLRHESRGRAAQSPGRPRLRHKAGGRRYRDVLRIDDRHCPGQLGVRPLRLVRSAVLASHHCDVGERRPERRLRGRVLPGGLSGTLTGYDFTYDAGANGHMEQNFNGATGNITG